ncbi:alpha beta-hydrolase [Coniophora puteana RWD-64-598 SS2]|uniref:Carboxylic ester hydrolase n=1 Tax=Coniophora puteana (strain RWD-64-598) TaxID=741705 RepID=A0A5M3MRT2_CONPW|nr:alpha beta-hydrolase [Coniophora puteana RWD-64-598 SS2]EIW81365.1 alpha beta-hydrolase [Coniophora puteana RWD-64-598 SS2]
MLRLALALSGLAAAVLCQGSPLGSSSASGGSAGNIVDVGYASYIGNQSFPNTVAYLGIPYAEPPVGDLRFRAPVALNTSRIAEQAGGQPVNATYYPDFCVQGTTGQGDHGGAGSEDCLKVNIYAPTGAKEGDNLPVLFYIHGGGYIYGNPANWPFDPWIHQSPDVVIVSIYYRLSSFGFFAAPAFVSDPSLGDFNAGFLDQVQGLRWASQYISKFGGDPNRITINGQSAGASSVELHMTANVGRELVVGAIAQSVYRTPLPLPDQMGPLFDFYSSYAGCGEGTAATKIACLRNASISALAMAQDAAVMGSFNASLYNFFRPVLDGKVFSGDPTAQFQSGNFAHVPLIVGSTSNETLAGGTNISVALKNYFPELTPEDLAGFREAMGGPASLYSNAWTYRYNQPNPTSGSNATAHAAENWMMFQGINTGYNGTGTFTPQTPVELTFASELIAYWLSFVRAGNPNTYKLAMSPEWTAYAPAKGDSDALRIVLQQDPQNVTTESGSYIEEQPTAEGMRCNFAISKVQHTQD